MNGHHTVRQTSIYVEDTWTGKYLYLPYSIRNQNQSKYIHTMLFYPTITREYFVKTQTYVALFGPHELSLIFSGGMCLELTSL